MKQTAGILIILAVMGGCGLSNSENTNPESEEIQPELSEKSLPESNITNQELEIFAELIETFYDFELEEEEKMTKIINDHGFTIERFNELYQAEQNLGQAIAIPKEESEKYEAVILKLDELQEKSQELMQTKIIESGLSPDRYQEIGTSLQKDSDLRERLRKIQEENL